MTGNDAFDELVDEFIKNEFETSPVMATYHGKTNTTTGSTTSPRPRFTSATRTRRSGSTDSKPPATA